jgi:hypothetical protein
VANFVTMLLIGWECDGERSRPTCIGSTLFATCFSAAPLLGPAGILEVQGQAGFHFVLSGAVGGL